MKYAISIIIPLYNNEEFIEQCLDTLLDQTFKDFEIIVVDDGSSDNSLKIVQSYEHKYDFIKVLQQKNQYAGVARNLGMKHAKGEYLLFLDSDDFFEPNMLEEIYNQARKTDADVVLFNAKKFDNVTKKYSGDGIFLLNNFLPDREVFIASDEDIYIYQTTTPCAWTKLFKKSFIDNLEIKFSNTPNTNDYYFTTIALASANKISYVNKSFVNYRINNDKSIKGKLGTGKLYITDILNDVYDELNRRNLYLGNVKHSFIDAATLNLSDNFKRLKSTKDRVYYYKKDFINVIEKLNILKLEPEDLLTNNSKTSLRLLKGIDNGVKWRSDREKYALPVVNEVIQKAKINIIPKISIIIPVYNAQNYLVETLDSVINQSLKDTEIICIDDGSTDKSLDILIEYAKKDYRITVIKQENYGSSTARNNGVSNASGEYLYIINEGDSLEKDALSVMYDTCHNEKLDILYFDANVYFDNNDLIDQSNNYNDYYTRKEISDEVVPGIELLNRFIDNNSYIVSEFLQVINRDYFIDNNCWFYPNILNSENLYTYKTILSARRVKYINQKLYLKRIYKESNTKTKNDFNNVYGYYICYKEMLNIFDSLDNIDEVKMDTITAPINSVVNRAREDLLEMKPEERAIVDYLDSKDKFLFKKTIFDVVIPSEQLLKANKKIRELNKKNKKLTNKLNKLKNHPIIKVGRKVKNIIKK